MGGVKFIDGHIQTISEQFRSLVEIVLLLAEDAVGKVDDPVDGMIITETGKYLNCFCQVLGCQFEVVHQHEVLGIVAVTNCVENVVLAHLFLPDLYCFLEVLEEFFLTCACVDLCNLFIDRRQEVVGFITLHFY